MYTELHLHSNYSFQEGASSIDELVDRAHDIGYEALAITDHDNLCAAMVFAQTCRDFGIRPIIGCEVTMVGGHHLTLLAKTRQGYANLCWLVSQAHLRDRRAPALNPAKLEGHIEGLIALSGCQHGEVPSLIDAGNFRQASMVAHRYRDLFGAGNYFLEIQQHYVHGDTLRNRRLADLAEDLSVNIVATGNVHYHIRDRHRLQDCLVAIRNNVSLEECHRERRPNSDFFLKSPQEIANRLPDYPEAIRNAGLIANRCADFDLSQHLGYQFPDHPVPEGHTPQTYLEQLCYQAAKQRYGDTVPQKVHDRLQREFRLTEKHHLAGFFLIYHDVAKIAQEVSVDLGLADPGDPLAINPPGRGRGSSVSMLIGYLIGISHIDPLEHNLSLDRFLPDDQLDGAPDIDLDFPRNIREELILRVHQKYGPDRAVLTGMIQTYRTRGAVRDLGKALGLPPDQTNKLAKLIDERDDISLREHMLDLPGFSDKVNAPPWNHLVKLASELEGFPRQLAQHPGGMVIGSGPLTKIVPVQPSAVDGRFIMQWDKHSIDYAHFVKIDFLSLGALSQMQDTVRAIEAQTGKFVDLTRIDFEDLAVYNNLHKADTIGVFQVESAAQMQTISRIKPRNLLDMAHEVAAVRPGVGANQGVHRYILRRAGLEKLEYDHPLEEPVLERTWGIILFQDQINHLAMKIGGFGASKADRMRRAFTIRHNNRQIQQWSRQFIEGARAKGVDAKTALKIFSKFNGHYMFPESHAFAFGITAYQGAWLKHYYPREFFLGLFNQQPMGFYNPETLKEDAKRHGVKILNPDVNMSDSKCTLEADHTIRLGLTYVKAIGTTSAKAIVAGRTQRPFSDLADFTKRSGLFQQGIENLIDAGALDSLCDDRRQARWEVGLRYHPTGQQLALGLPIEQDLTPLPEASPFDEMAREYQMLGMHPRSHVMAYVRQSLGQDITPSDEISNLPDGKCVTVAGLVIRRQRPLGNTVFITLEDEFGHIPILVWPKNYARMRNDLKAPFLLVTGIISRREDTLNIVAQDVKPMHYIPTPPESRNFH